MLVNMKLVSSFKCNSVKQFQLHLLVPRFPNDEEDRGRNDINDLFFLANKHATTLFLRMNGNIVFQIKKIHTLICSHQ